ncbi:1-acyl-sn-glycerol-3-phosphate acyltransferase protein [Rutstroemia sp. NJR-2017a BVV2]|nr:1-acyl-sn-glycerol-3-phosphate acyltransferase protein [Rutstroemia sp. NJR-2017a BVV2]PQE18461.1 1-acyl-sn-glycerol-3-phosphate acyltransferase protein [Rutstroemia sp. NJR-2017a BVV2]
MGVKVGASDVLTSIRGVLLVIPWLLELVLMDVLISLFLPFSYLFPNWVYNASSFIAFTNWNWIQFIFEVFNGGKISISGDVLPEGETAIVIANHVSWTDFYMIQALAIRAGMLSRCRWFAKIELRWVPLLGWGIWGMGMPMVSRNWLKDKKELDRVFAGVVVKKWPQWLISFSEATRFTPKKYEETKIWCKENNRPVPKHLLYPRTKGFVTTVQHLRKAEHVKAVYDMTIAYSRHNKFHEAPTIWESLSCGDLSGSRGYKFHVDVKRFPLDELPETDAELAKWLEQRWLAKGEFLEAKREEWSRSLKPIAA